MPTSKRKQTFYSVFINGEVFDVTGRKRTPLGYVALCIRKHPFSDMQGYIFEHRIMMEMKLGRFLKASEIVHHKNEVKHDNRIDNLEVMMKSKHTILHHKGSKRSEETKDKIALRAKERLKDKRNHASYKHIDKNDFVSMLFKYGPTITAKNLGITRRTVYNKIKEFRIEDEYNERNNING